MRSISPELSALLERPSIDRLVTLIEIVQDIRTFRWALGHAVDVTYEGNLYVAQGGAHTEIYQDTLGRRTGLTLTIQNQMEAETRTPQPFWSRAFSYIDLNGAEVRFVIVPLELLGVANSAIVEEFWVISGYEVTAKSFSARVASPLDIFVANIPRQPLVSGSTIDGPSYPLFQKNTRRRR